MCKNKKKSIIGLVRWFNDNKGYGFISTSSINEEIFVHYKDIQGDGFQSLSEGQEVIFELEQSTKGPIAVRVQKNISQ